MAFAAKETKQLKHKKEKTRGTGQAGRRNGGWGKLLYRCKVWEKNKNTTNKNIRQFRLGLLDLGFKYDKLVSSLKQRYRKEII